MNGPPTSPPKAPAKTPVGPPSRTPPTAAPPRRTSPVEQPQSVPRLANLTPTAKPPRIVLNAVEGFGKTSCAAHADDSAILMAAGETGYETLLQAGRVPSVLTVTIGLWSDLLGVLDALIDKPLGIKTLALDAIGGFERLCHQHVCDRDFRGDWGEKGFLGYNKGYELSVTEWLKLLVRLDRLRDEHNIGILLLSHCKVKMFKNPLGEDYDRYISDVHEKTWGSTHKWADAVLFGNFFTVIEKNRPADKRGKGVGGVDRVLYTEHRDAFDAKNRFGLPPVLDIPDDPTQIWTTISQAIRQEK